MPPFPTASRRSVATMSVNSVAMGVQEAFVIDEMITCFGDRGNGDALTAGKRCGLQQTSRAHWGLRLWTLTTRGRHDKIVEREA